MATRQAPEELVERLQELLGSLEEIADPTARERVEELMGTLLEMYGVGMERILEIVEAGGETGEQIKREMADDGVVASLMLIHGLYPVSLEERVEEALEGVRPLLATHDGDVELLGVSDDGVAGLRLKGSCDGCPASALTLESLIREALEAAAPDLAGIDVEGIVPPPRHGPITPSAPAMALPMVQVGGDGASLPMQGGYTACPSQQRA